MCLDSQAEVSIILTRCQDKVAVLFELDLTGSSDNMFKISRPALCWNVCGVKLVLIINLLAIKLRFTRHQDITEWIGLISDKGKQKETTWRILAGLRRRCKLQWSHSESLVAIGCHSEGPVVNYKVRGKDSDQRDRSMFRISKWMVTRTHSFLFSNNPSEV